ncbi:MAG: DNA/RNA nuclease SfsA [Rhodospirillales bacterium]
MQPAATLVPATLIRRYKRFLADAVLASGEIVTAHCPNSGSMLSVNAPGSEIWLSRNDAPSRTLRYTWELVRVGDTLVGINTGRPNALVAAAIAGGDIPELAGYDRLRREVRYGGNCRIDLLLEKDGERPCYVEVKNVTLKRDPAAEAPVEFPDSVTQRGRKHLSALADVVSVGGRAVILYLAQRGDGCGFAIATDIDPAYAEAHRAAIHRGVEALCYRCHVSTSGIHLAGPMKMVHRVTTDDDAGKNSGIA